MGSKMNRLARRITSWLSFTSLRVRLVFLIVFAGLPVALVLLGIFWYERDAASATAQQAALEDVRHLAGDYEQSIENLRAPLVRLSGVPALQKGNPPPCASFFSELKSK
jgi:hypothetical protein